ncbi:hypothetical protein [Streptomyces clavifer]|uniref:hypothetical protein n=1 Tax=Streptomyces clavifer TaxID=68188 RepID=UPI0037117F3D
MRNSLALGPADRQLLLDGGQGHGLDLNVLAGRGGVEQHACDAALGAPARGQAGVVLGLLSRGLDAGGLLADLGRAQLGLGGLLLRLGGVAAGGGGFRRLQCVGLGTGLTLRL